VTRERVRENERVLVSLVTKEIVDPLVLEQARHEGKVALPVLHAILALQIGRAMVALIVRLDVPDVMLLE
jgi:hypothetical protein